jgi:hypothetical protein
VYALSAFEYLLCQRGSHLGDVLTAVENDEHLLVAEKGNQSGDRVLGMDHESDRRSERARDKVWFTKW